MKVIRSKEFTAHRPWAALSVANMNGITTRLLDRSARQVAHLRGQARILVVERDGSVKNPLLNELFLTIKSYK